MTKRERICPECGAPESEIGKRGAGHRLVEKTPGSGRFTRPCPEACTCIPEHFNVREHDADCAKCCASR